jgi:universal stress protein A
MEDIKKILVVSQSTKESKKVVHYGFSLSRKYNALLYVLHVVHDPITVQGWNLPSLALEEYRQKISEAKEELHDIINTEKENGLHVIELIREGKPAAEILRVVEDEKIDLIIMLAHQEGRLEHFFFGRTNEEIIRSMPCSVLLVRGEFEVLSD